MKRLLLPFITLIFLAASFSGCESGDTEPRNMEQIYAEEGVPVRVESLKHQNFTTELEFNAALTGIEESSAYASIDDQVDRIYASVGDFVNKDDIVISFPTDNPTARYYQAKVSFENGEATFRRMENLYNAGGISLQALDNARTAFRVAEADWQSVQQSIKVEAPISGIITKINVRKSDNVRKDDELFTVSRIDKMKATIWISDRQISDFKVGVKTTATWNNVVIQGSLVQVDMSMNQSLQAFGVVAEFDNPDMRIKGGVTAEIRVESYCNPTAIVIERKDIIQDASGIYVFVTANGKAVRRPILLGRPSGIYVEVISGLSDGDLFITEGQMHLKDGTKIRIIEPTPAIETK